MEEGWEKMGRGRVGEGRGDLKGRGKRGEREDGLKWEKKVGERRGKG